VSTEQRDKAAVEWERNTLLDFDDYFCAGIGFKEGWDAHAATMPDRKAIRFAVRNVIEGGMSYDSNDYVQIADAIMDLLNKGGGE
jgi:hypothetical protein